jgi:uncharacterized protein YdeI (YjbR/CyaY-like superfamily)
MSWNVVTTVACRPYRSLRHSDGILAIVTSLDDAERVPVETRAQWRAWLADHHTRRDGVFVVTWRKASGRPAPTYDEIVSEALAFGWIDSLGRSLDAERTMLYVAPRTPRSGWSRPNKERVARLLEEDLLTEAGAQVIDSAVADGSWSLLDDVENLVVPEDLEAALSARAGARQSWDAFPRSARRGILEWIVQAKRPETRARRVTETAAKAAVGERANQWRRRATDPDPGPDLPEPGQAG